MRYAVISDVHANFEALQAVDQAVQRLRREKADVQYWFLGDLLGYGPDPIDCIKWMRYKAKIRQRWIPGNHDEEVVRLGEKGGPIIVPAVPTTNDFARRSWALHAAALLDLANEDQYQWFSEEVFAAIEPIDDTNEERRSMVVEEYPNLVLIFVHGAMEPRFRRSTYLRPEKIDLELNLEHAWDKYGSSHKTVCLIHGHTHFPLFAKYDSQTRKARFQQISFGQPLGLDEGCFAINPGSLGVPRDGDPRAAYAVLDPEVPSITFHRVMYDVLKTVGKLEVSGYPQEIIDLLLEANGGIDLAEYRAFYDVPDWNLRRVVNPQ
jgi:predicted phosphodiesterase